MVRTLTPTPTPYPTPNPNQATTCLANPKWSFIQLLVVLLVVMQVTHLGTRGRLGLGWVLGVGPGY